MKKIVTLQSMNQDESKILLTITPIDDKTAQLVKVVGVTNQNTVFTNTGSYEGFNYFKTGKSLRIDIGIFKGKEYTITSIIGCSFSHCRNLEEIFIGAEIKHIEWNMYQCTSLANIKVDSGNGVYHDIDGVLFKGKELIAYPQGRRGKYVVPAGTTKLGNHSFKSSMIEEIELPETLEEIGINVFYECNSLKEIVLPRNLKHVASNCNIGNRPILQKFYLADDVKRVNPLTIEEVLKKFPE